MAGRRIIYLLAWFGCMVFFWAYQEWFAWFALVTVVCLPIFSLLLSLPAMLTAKLELHCPPAVPMGMELVPELRYRSFMPTPPWKCGILVRSPLHDCQWQLHVGDPLPTDHCGALVCSLRKPKVCDYLGLFSLPLHCSSQTTVLVRPDPVRVERIPELDFQFAQAWRPKPGGGFAENHELRLYRPGDSVQQIHWKLSAKTGDLILREPMEPVRRRVLLRLDLNGTPEELDKKIGQIAWLGSQLLALDIYFEVQSLSGDGIESWYITNTSDHTSAMDELLSRTPALSGSIRDRAEQAAWQYHIGGGTDET